MTSTTSQPLAFDKDLPQTSTAHHGDHDTILNFTATGRAFSPAKAQHGSAHHIMSAEALGADGGTNHLPRRYNDDSLITIPVLPLSAITRRSFATPEQVAAADAAAQTSPTSPTTSFSTSASSYPVYDPSTTSDDGPIKQDTSSSLSGLKFWKSRKTSISSSNQGLLPESSLSSSSSPRKSSYSNRKGKKEKAGVNFVMKQVPRGEYLKHYAKDEKGIYIGSEEPAVDCILRDEGDLRKWRTPVMQWKNEI